MRASIDALLPQRIRTVHQQEENGLERSNF